MHAIFYPRTIYSSKPDNVSALDCSLPYILGSSLIIIIIIIVVVQRYRHSPTYAPVTFRTPRHKVHVVKGPGKIRTLNTLERDTPQHDRPATLLSPNSILPSCSSHSASIPARKYSEERVLKMSLFQFYCLL